jgi:hypothetical protein
VFSLDFVEGGKFVLFIAFCLSMVTAFMYSKEFIRIVGYEEGLEERLEDDNEETDEK